MILYVYTDLCWIPVNFSDQFWGSTCFAAQPLDWYQILWWDLVRIVARSVPDALVRAMRTRSCFMKYHGISWNIMEYLGISWNIDSASYVIRVKSRRLCFLHLATGHWVTTVWCQSICLWWDRFAPGTAGGRWSEPKGAPHWVWRGWCYGVSQ